LLPRGFLAANIQSDASRPGFFLIAKANGNIIGCNGFIANDFLLNNENFVGYQSCWSAILPGYQGKGIFSDIINEAKRILKEDGAGFLYGVPSDNSGNIMINKLAFDPTPAFVTRLYNIPLYSSFILKKNSVDNENVCSVNEKQVCDHKAIQSPAEVKIFYHNNSWLWGKLIKKTKWGVNWPVFYVGGVQLYSERDLQPLIKKIFKAHFVLFIQLLIPGTHTIKPLIANWRPANINPFVLYRLNIPVFDHFNVMIGSIDIF
ncbi:MAG TPA: GNAT family N-acetyltransferase, partial [Ferruginibacter sp.]|nr:GNAT family N-acetyltransferase [Ferruginibacter sp.]